MIAAFTLNVSLDRRYVVANNCPGAVNRVQECSYSAGGKGLNVARILHTLGKSVLAGGIVGGDTGRYILRRLDEEGIPYHFSPAAGETRSCINILDLASGKQTEYLEPGMFVSPEEYELFLGDFDDIATRYKVITLSGSLPKGLAADTYADLVRRGKARGCKVLLDSSGAALTAAIESRPYYIKPNEDEIKALVGCDVNDEAQLAEAALQLHKKGIANVVVSMGSRGALLACEEGIFRAAPPKLDVVNTVGCGDSMTAAFAAATEQEFSPAEALRYAVAVSAASALSPLTGGLELSDFETIKDQVQVYTL